MRQLAVALLLPLSSLGACESPHSSGVDAGPQADLALVEQQSDLQLKNGSAGAQEIMPLDDGHYSLAFQVGNDSGELAVIDSIELIGSKGLVVGADMAVGRPRAYGGMSADLRYPPPRDWPKSSEMPLEGVEIPAAGEDAQWGIIAVFEVTQTEKFAYARVWKVTGTLGGQPFTDYVYTGYAICKTRKVTPQCRKFPNENVPPIDLAARAREGS